MDLEAELEALVRALNAAGIPYALIGGLALAIYGRPRATRDIDLLVAADDWEKIRAALEPIGFRHAATPVRLSSGELEFRRLTKLAGKDYVVAGFLIPSEGVAAALGGRQQIAWRGTELQVALPEVIIDLKRRRNSPQDRADIAALESVKP